MDNRKPWIEWIKNIPNWVKAAILFIGVIVGFIISFRENSYLYVTVSVALLLVGAFGFSLFIAFTKTRPMIEGGRGMYRFERYRPWAFVGMVLILGLISLSLASRTSRGFIVTALVGTPTPTPTPTSTPTLAPTTTPSPTPKPTEVTLPAADVLVAEFDSRHATRTLEVAHRLEAALQARLRTAGLEDVRVQVVSQSITSEDEAQSLANNSGSKVVIWGWYDDIGIQVRVFLSGGDQPGREVPGTRELPLELGGETNAQLSFVVRDVLPENISFLSLFVIGHLHYMADEYQAGHQAFDAAMLNIPKNVALQNEAILHFFRARQLEAGGSEDMASIICEYAKAIDLNPSFAEAYNNLGIVFARHYYPFSDINPVLTLEGVRSCLDETGVLETFENWFPTDFFNRALELQPDWAIAEYNKMGFYWENLDFVLLGVGNDRSVRSIAELKKRLEEVIQRDPTIPGAYLVLGNIAFYEEEDLESAAKWYSEALGVASEPEKIQINLAQIYLLQGKYEEAEALLQAAIAQNASNPEAELALANLAHHRGQTTVALEHLRAIPPEEEKIFLTSAQAAGLVLRSNLEFERDQITAAIRTLEQVIARTYPSGEPVEAPLERYLLGLYYLLQGDEEKAWSIWETIDLFNTPEGSYGTTSALAWADISLDCGFDLYDPDPEAEGLATNPCLPVDLEARIAAVYEKFRDRLPYRLYYRSFLYGGAACPYVFTYNEVVQEWQFETTILYNLRGAQNESWQSRPLQRFNGKLLIRELEPEISYIDQLSILMADHKDGLRVLTSQVPALLKPDGDYLVLKTGDEILLTFDDFRKKSTYQQFWVVAQGYYIPVLPGQND